MLGVNSFYVTKFGPLNIIIIYTVLKGILTDFDYLS